MKGDPLCLNGCLPSSDFGYTFIDYAACWNSAWMMEHANVLYSGVSEVLTFYSSSCGMDQSQVYKLEKKWEKERGKITKRKTSRAGESIGQHKNYNGDNGES